MLKMLTYFIYDNFVNFIIIILKVIFINIFIFLISKIFHVNLIKIKHKFYLTPDIKYCDFFY